MIRTLDSAIKSEMFANKKLFAFGHSNATEEMIAYLGSRGITVLGILDNNESKNGLKSHNTVIMPPRKVLECEVTRCVVLIASRFYDQMVSDLIKLGYSGEILKVIEYNTFAEYSLSKETFERKLARIRRGDIIRETIRAEYPSNHLVVCPNNALGDVFWAMAYLSAYLKFRCISDPVVIATGKGASQTVKLFKIKNMIALDQSEMDEFVQSLIFCGDDNFIIAHHDRPYTDVIIKYLNKHFLSFIDYYCHAVYGLPKGTEPELPESRISPVKNAALKKGESMIIAPYAKSVVNLPMSFWESLVKKNQERGMTVFTNTVTGEQPIPGTQSLTLPLDQLIAAAEFTGCFIGLRSGLCDILVNARCRKTVVYPDCFYSTTPYKVSEFFALPHWESILYNP